MTVTVLLIDLLHFLIDIIPILLSDHLQKSNKAGYFQQLIGISWELLIAINWNISPTNVIFG